MHNVGFDGMGFNLSRPIAGIRKLSLATRKRFTVPLWQIVSFMIGAALVLISPVLPTAVSFRFFLAGFVVSFLAAQLLIFSAVGFSPVTKSKQAAKKLTLMDQGIENPDKYLKKNPDLVEVHRTVALGLGISHLEMGRKTKADAAVYEASLLVLSGKVDPNDSPLLVSVIKRGITDTDEVIAAIADMKDNGYTLADGTL